MESYQISPRLWSGVGVLEWEEWGWGRTRRMTKRWAGLTVLTLLKGEFKNSLLMHLKKGFSILRKLLFCRNTMMWSDYISPFFKESLQSHFLYDNIIIMYKLNTDTCSLASTLADTSTQCQCLIFLPSIPNSSIFYFVCEPAKLVTTHSWSNHLHSEVV